MSSSSEVSSLATLSRPAALLRKSSVEVKIHDHYNAKVYTSGSAISGVAVITPQRDTYFDHIQIVLTGTARTRLEALQVPQKSTHVFLKLDMPIPESAYPVPRIFEAGRVYTIPFNFVVPSHLTISACNHPAESDYIHDYHMRLPPSVGRWTRDDLSPETAQIEYAIKARVLREPRDDHERHPVRLFEGQHLISILPASPEDPPLNVTANDNGYVLSKTKSIRKKLFAGKIGRFHASAAQPTAVQLSSDGRKSSGTAATILLSFQPTTSDISPPKVNSISAKLTSTTYYSATPMSRLPNLGTKNSINYEQRLGYTTSVSLFSTGVDKVTWREQLLSQARRDSGYSTDDRESEEDDTKFLKSNYSPVYYTGALHIPFKLPTDRKLFLPTFYSCLISRTYTLNLTLSVGSGNTSISLALPLQVAVESAYNYLGPNQGLPSFDAAMAQQEEAEADEYLRPRLLQMPSPELQMNSILPGYDAFGTGRVPVRA